MKLSSQTFSVWKTLKYVVWERVKSNTNSFDELFILKVPKDKSRQFNPFPNNKFQTSKLKGFADNNFKYDENDRKLSKQVENTVGKGETARHKQFLLFPVFSKDL